VRTRDVLVLGLVSLSFGLAISNVFFPSAELGWGLAMAVGVGLGAFGLSLILRKRARPGE
jgi:hypothetical protein